MTIMTTISPYKSRSLAAVLLFVALLGCSLHNKPKPTSTSRQLSLRADSTRTLEEIRQYNQAGIERTVPFLDGYNHPRLLVFDGESFGVYNINHKDGKYASDTTFGRGGFLVPLMVRALYQQFPDRFKKGQPVWQMLFLDSDSVGSTCVNPGRCDGQDFVPIPVFGSVPKSTKLPVKAFPNYFYVKCLFEYKINHVQRCHWQESDEIRQALPYDQLQPQLVWRGSDFGFLPEYDRFRTMHSPRINESAETPESTLAQVMGQWDELPPRWRAVSKCAEARVHHDGAPHWINARFSGNGITEHHHQLEQKLGVELTQEDRMDPEEMATFKYQLAIGGGGGTSWRGTISKLGMPGVLFQVESPTKDWFYDQLQAFKNYIPVEWSLGDLEARFKWAEQHPSKAKEISEEASKLHSFLMSTEYMDQVYEELFVNYLGQVVQKYETTFDSWKSMKQLYQEHGFKLQQVSVCNDGNCRTRDSTGVWNQEVFDK